MPREPHQVTRRRIAARPAAVPACLFPSACAFQARYVRTYSRLLFPAVRAARMSSRATAILECFPVRLTVDPCNTFTSCELLSPPRPRKATRRLGLFLRRRPDGTVDSAVDWRRVDS